MKQNVRFIMIGINIQLNSHNARVSCVLLYLGQDVELRVFVKKSRDTVEVVAVG